MKDGHSDEGFYLRQIARMTGVGMGALQRELKQLTEAGILTRSAIGQQALFKANSDCPVYRELRDIVVKTFGVADVLGEALSPLADKIKAAFIYGSMAGDEFRRSSDVDVMVIGDISFADVVSALSPAQEVLSREINRSLRHRFGTLKRGVHSKYPLMAFTEQGVAMLSSVLNSRRAVEVKISIIRAFAQLRRMISTHTELALKLKELEERLDDHDEKILVIFEAIKKLIEEDEGPKVLIDTNTVSYMMRGQTEAQAYAKGLQGNLLAISFATDGEIFYGTEKALWRTQKRLKL